MRKQAARHEICTQDRGTEQKENHSATREWPSLGRVDNCRISPLQRTQDMGGHCPGPSWWISFASDDIKAQTALRGLKGLAIDAQESSSPQPAPTRSVGMI